jgi:hypothetical protein
MSFTHEPGSINLQATLASVSAGGEQVFPHFPITCQSELRFNDDGSFECDHATAPPGHERTQACLNHSLAILLIEGASKL